MQMKTFRLIVVILLAPVWLSAQKFEGGLFAGLNASQVAGDVASGYHKVGLTFGGFASLRLNDHSELRMELAYSQKGSRLNPTDEDPRQYLLRVNYIDLPLLYRYHYNQKLTFEGGLSYGYLMNHYEEADYYTFVSSAGFNTHALNIIAGLSYRLSDQFSAGFRSVNSLIPLRDHVSGVKRLFNRGQYNDVLTLSLYYHFKKNDE